MSRRAEARAKVVTRQVKAPSAALTRARAATVAAAPPELLAFVFGSHLLALPQAVAWAWWQALRGAEGHQAVAVRGVLYAPFPPPMTVEKLTHLFRDQLPPTRWVLTTEALVEEGRLQRAEAALIEEAVLRYTTRDGQWTFVVGTEGTMPPFARTPGPLTTQE